MLGMSLSKLLVLALLVGAVWYGFKWINRKAGTAERNESKPSSAPGNEDLTACPACGTFVPAGLAACPGGRKDCPMVSG